MKPARNRIKSGEVRVHMTKPRPMGNNVKHNIEDAADYQVVALGELEEITARKMEMEEVLRHTGAAIVALSRSLRLLEQSGAQTRPPCLSPLEKP